MKPWPIAAVLIAGLLTGFCTRAQPDNPPDAVVIEMDIPLRLRAAPNIQSSILDLLDSGTRLRLIGRTVDNAWLEVETERYSVGWVFADYVELFASLDDVRVSHGAAPEIDYRATIIGISANARDIFARGQQMGNRAGVFAKVGDSITVAPHMLQPISRGWYNLDRFDYLQAAIDYFSQTPASDVDSFGHTSVAAQVGWSTVTVLDPAYADPDVCLPGESPLLCEYRRVQPAIALIMFGTNDVGIMTAATYRAHLEKIVALSVDAGVLPVISTIPPRVGFEDEVARFNQIVREIARDHDVPLWDYGRVMAAVGDFGLDEDGVHPSISPRGVEDSADFRPSNLYYGYVLRNLVALHALDALLHQVIAPDETDS